MNVIVNVTWTHDWLWLRYHELSVELKKISMGCKIAFAALRAKEKKTTIQMQNKTENWYRLTSDLCHVNHWTLLKFNLPIFSCPKSGFVICAILVG